MAAVCHPMQTLHLSRWDPKVSHIETDYSGKRKDAGLRTSIYCRTKAAIMTSSLESQQLGRRRVQASACSTSSDLLGRSTCTICRRRRSFAHSDVHLTRSKHNSDIESFTCWGSSTRACVDSFVHSECLGSHHSNVHHSLSHIERGLSYENGRRQGRRGVKVQAIILEPGDGDAGDFAKRLETSWVIRKQPVPVACETCCAEGSTECPWCAGTGFFILGDNMLCEVPSRNTSCLICQGHGTIKCADCKGTGFRARWMGTPPKKERQDGNNSMLR